VDVRDIVEAALGAGLDAIAVTDHNSVKCIEPVRSTADGTGLCVFPGVEITTGNGHFLAIFELDTPVSNLEEFLDDIGIDKNGRGDAHTVATEKIDVILEKVKEYGGIAIAAHIDRWPSGFLETKDSRKQKQEIHENEYLDGLEITIPKNRKEWKNGRMRGFPMKRACIQGSDAHNPTEIGRRPVYIKMENTGLEGIKNALDNYETDILFPEDIEEDS
jgi:PHP family Zn ribbon phosphoesterase